MNITKKKTDASMPVGSECIPRVDAMSGTISLKVFRSEFAEMQVMAWTSCCTCDEALEGLLTALDGTLETLISGTLDQIREQHETAKSILRDVLLKHAKLSDSLTKIARFQEVYFEHCRKESEVRS